MNRLGFDNGKYLEEQKAFILDRMSKVEGKLYIECGGKLLFDYHAARVLPGFDTNDKMKVFQSFKDNLDVIICIHAGDIEHRKMRSDFGISYDTDVFKMIDDFAAWGIKADKVVVTRYNGERSANNFADMLTRRGIKVYFHKPIMGYPDNVDMVVSDQGYGSNPYIPTEASVVIVTAPGPGSGKLATCLSQIYHDFRSGRKAGYAKFESFPIWNLPIDHPVNIAYEAATADIGDYNQIDHYYVSATGKIAVNYNRDMEAFPLLKRILDKISNGSLTYNSPTDMGVNRLGFGISDDAVVREAANQEIIRRYFRSACEYAQGIGTKDTVQRSFEIMTKAGLVAEDRPTVRVALGALDDAIARGKSKDGIACAAAIQLTDGRFVTAHNSPLMHASSALVLNSLKVLAGIDREVELIPHEILDSVYAMKRDDLRGRGISLNLDETLICLAMAATMNSYAKKALSMLPQLRGCESHMSHIPSAGDSSGLRKLGINVTSEPKFPTNNMRNF
jgi:uncharacterized protein (UPF0371 family)